MIEATPWSPDGDSSPAERALRHLLSHPDVLDHSAFILSGGLSLGDLGEWDGLPEHERQVWRDRVIEIQRAFVRENGGREWL